MAITDVNQFPEDLRNAATVPVAPGAPPPEAVLPVANALAPAAPDATNQTAPPAPITPIGTPAASATEPTHAEKIGIVAAQAPTPPGPGGWAKRLVASATSALQSMQTGLGDMEVANAEVAKSHPYGGAGVLDYLGAQANAKAARLQAAKVAQTAEDKARADIAMSNIQRMYHQMALHQMSDEANHKDIANGQAQIEAMTTHNVELGLAPAAKLFTKITDAQYNDLVHTGKIDPTKTSYIPDGSLQPLDPKTGKPMVDENNQPVLSKTFTVLEPPKVQVLTNVMVDRINRYVPTANLPHGTEDHPVVIPGISALAYMEQANAAETYQAKRDADLAKAGAEKLDADQKIASDNASSELAKNQPYLKAIAHFPNDLASLYRYMTGQYPEMVNGKPTGKMDPGSIEAAKTNAGPLIILKYGGEKGYSKVVEDQAKDFEKERHDAAVEAQKGQVTPAIRYQQEQENFRAEKKTKGGVDLAPATSAGLTGEDYIKTLPANVQGNVRAVGEGRLVMSPRQLQDAGGQAFSSSVQAAYPDYDETKAKTWGKSRNEYMGSGATAKKVVSYNTALEHMQDLYSNSTAAGLYEPGSKAYSDRNVALGYVSNEVGNAIKNGVMSQKEGDEITDSLKGWTPGTARERTAETARLLHDKIEEYQRKFEESAPSSAVKVPILISPKAAAAYDYVQSGGKQQAAPAPALPPAALSQLKEGQHTTFGNGQTWTLQGGKAVQVQGQ